MNAGPDQTITLGSAANLTGSAVDDGLPNLNGRLTYTWLQISGPGRVKFGNARKLITTADFSATGTYTLKVSANDGVSVGMDILAVTVNPTPGAGTTSTRTATTESATTSTSVGPQIVEFSTQSSTAASHDAIINGFVLGGSGQKTVIFRALGPSLTALDVPDAMTDPELELYDSDGTLIASNDNWRDAQEALFADAGPYESFRPESDREAAIVITLPPGTYWTMVKSKDNSAGVAVAELSDLSEGTGLEIVSLSGRGLIQSEDNVVMSDFTVEGDTASNLIIRALGPSLNNSGSANMVSDLVLELYDENGSILSTNDNWQEDAEQANQIMARGLVPADSAEAAMVVSLSPGNYTAVIRGKNNTLGVASLEVYKLP